MNTITPLFSLDINLSLFNSHGGLVFSKVFDFYNVNPCLNDNQRCLGYGSDLLVYDYNKDGFDDIGIYLEGAYDSPYGIYIKFFDRNGNEIASNKAEFGEGSHSITNAVLADMNSNNKLDLITKKHIYNLDGSVLYNFSGDYRQAITVDIDKNGALDILLFNKSHTMLLLGSNNYSIDFSVAEEDISFKPLNNTHSIVAAEFRSNIEANADVMLLNAETGESVNGSIVINGGYNFSAVMALSRGDKVRAGIDYKYKVNETNEKNNFDERMFEGLPYVYVSIDADQNPQLPLQEIENYIKNNLVLGYYTDDKSIADMQIIIGKTHPLNILDRDYTQGKYRWGYKSIGGIDYFDRRYTAPYAGIVGRYSIDGKDYIAVYGNSIAGNIAAAKELIKRQSDFIYAIPGKAIAVDDENVDAIGIYDYLHQPGNEQYYGEDSANFANAVKNALNGETFSAEVRTVTTSDGIQLRLKHLIPNRSSTYMEILNYTGVPVDIPVVLARGIHSNLTTWEVLAGELADSGRDTWLIEITGGPGQDCDDCPNYNFSDLTDKYWPALINGVLGFTGKEKVQYVGHSNGCRTALESLRLNRVSSNKVDTFIGVGCPGAFNYDSPGKLVFDTFGDEMMILLNNKAHLSADEIGGTAKGLCFKYFDALSSVKLTNCISFGRSYSGVDKISYNLAKSYNEWINNITDQQPGQNLTFDYFKMFYGTTGVFETIATGQSDGIVAQGDIIEISDEINTNIKKGEPEESYRVLGMFHTSENPKKSLPDNKRTKEKIKKKCFL